MNFFTGVLLSLAAAMAFCKTAEAQQINQTVKGRITDAVKGSPLSHATILISGGAEPFGSYTDEYGNFSVSIPVGRYKIKISYTGYAPVEHELLVIAGRESVVNSSLTPSSRELREVEVSGLYLPDVMPGQRILSIEKTLRIPANFFDPVRVATAYPGVVASNDQANAIIVRGNSPNGLLWRLNGLDIVNPNHLANAGTLSDKPSANGGGVNIMSAQMLDRTDFFMGAFPANYGNALSGIIDMKLREGNKNKHEYTAQASLIGMDVSAEGPVGQKQNTSFLANYRYSTVGLLSLMGLDFGGEAIAFQDLSFNINSQLKKGGSLSFFGFGGNSKNDFTSMAPDEWEEDKHKYDIEYKSGNYAAGLTYMVPVYRGKFFIGAAYSGGHQERTAAVSPEIDPLDVLLLVDDYNLNNKLLSGNVKYQTFLGEKGTFDIGMMTNYVDNDISSVKETGCLSCANNTQQELSGSNSGLLLQPFTNFNFAITGALSMTAGVRYLQYTYNNSSSLEPRAGLTLKPSDNLALDLSYGLVSQIQLPQVYAATSNSDLGFTKSHHLDLGYTQTLTNNFNLRAGIFYQSLFDVPVEANVNSTFSSINLLEGFVPGNLVNEGTGENYGAEITLEKYFYTQHYFMVGGSYYESKYTAMDGIKRNTRFNGNYTFSTVYGKEWTNNEKNRTIGLNSRLLYLGGLRQSAVNLTASQSSSETVYDSSDPYSGKLADYFRIDFRLSFRKNKPRYTRTFAIDIQNLTSQQNEAYQYYDFTQQKIVTKFQLGIIPVLVYRIDF